MAVSPIDERNAAAVGSPRAADELRVAGLAVQVWLVVMAVLVFAMVIVGGATRLTDSGLSITEWKPILGAIPPLNNADWQVAFEKYRAIPEYQKINKGMSLAEFQFIYWWEWGHRQLGRFLGLAFFIPFVALLALGQIPRRYLAPLLGLFAMGGLQGFAGWYMVQSGLVDRVDVSQYRLALHLTLATLIFAAIVWLVFRIGRERALERSPVQPGADEAWPGGRPAWLVVSSVGLVVIVIVQVALGAFVAGLDAGLSHNTWPLMDGAWIPGGLLVMQPWWVNAFENVATVQFNHRMMAYAITLWAAANAWFVWRNVGDAARVRWAAGFVLASVLAQVAIGIWTLLAQVPLWLGLVHQGGALVVLLAVLWQAHAVVNAPIGRPARVAPLATEYGLATGR